MQTISKRAGSIVLFVAGIVASYTGGAQAVDMRYWFDHDTDRIQTIEVTPGQPITIPYNPDMRNVAVSINYQIKDESGNWTVTYRQYFTPAKSSDFKYMYTVDALEAKGLTGDRIEAECIPDGFHKMTLVEKQGLLLPRSAMFVKRSTLPDNLSVALTSTRNKFARTVTITKGQKQMACDVRGVDPGIYPMVATVTNPVSGELIAVSRTIADIQAPGGNTLSDMYYWLNDSISYVIRQDMGNKSIPLDMSTEVSIAKLNIPSIDNRLSIIDGVPYMAPKYRMAVAFRNSLLFMDDSIAQITDNSKLRKLKPLRLYGRGQIDTDVVKSDTCYWYSFDAQTGDVVDFSARIPCRVKLYDPTAVLLDSTIFSDDSKKLRSTIATPGTYYVQLSEIEQTRQIFSAKLRYIDGPTASNDMNQESGHSHEGIPIEWTGASQWSSTDRGISLTDQGVEMHVENNDGDRDPYVATKSALCRIFSGNTLSIKAKKYIEKVTLCVPEESDFTNPKIETSNGKISIDSVTNCIVWSGLSEQPELVFANKAGVDATVLPVSKVYVKISDLSSDDVKILDTEDSEPIDYAPFNVVWVWSEDTEPTSYALDEVMGMLVEDGCLIVHCGDSEYRHPIKKKIILTYEYMENSGIAPVENGPLINISANRIQFNSLPAMVGIYAISGLTYFEQQVSDPEFSYPFDRLSRGVYIIKVGSRITKILIQ